MPGDTCILCHAEPRLENDRLGARCRQRISVARRQHDGNAAEHGQRLADQEEALRDRKVNDDLGAIKEGDWPEHRLARLMRRR